MSSESPAVAHICYGGEGGQLAAVRTLVEEFDRLGLSSAVVALGPQRVLKRDPGEWSHPSHLVSVPIARQGDLGSMVKVASAVRKIKPRVLICHSHRHAVAGVLGQIVSGCRPALIVVEHQSTHLRSTKDNLLSGIALAVGRAVVFLTREYQQQYPLRKVQALLRRPGFVVPNGVKAKPRRSLKGQGMARSGRQSMTVGMTSRLVATKQHDVLIRAIRILLARPGYAEVRLLIAGEGPTLEGLKQLAEELGVNDVVEFRGHIPIGEVPDFLDTLDVYAHATLGEGFSIALLEAAESGVPIVVSDVPGVNEFFVNDETALLVPPSNPEAMADGIARALDPVLGSRLASAARDWVLSNYSSDRIAADYLVVLSFVDSSGGWTPTGH